MRCTQNMRVALLTTLVTLLLVGSNSAAFEGTLLEGHEGTLATPAGESLPFRYVRAAHPNFPDGWSLFSIGGTVIPLLGGEYTRFPADAYYQPWTENGEAYEVLLRFVAEHEIDFSQSRVAIPNRGQGGITICVGNFWQSIPPLGPCKIWTFAQWSRISDVPPEITTYLDNIIENKEANIKQAQQALALPPAADSLESKPATLPLPLGPPEEESVLQKAIDADLVTVEDYIRSKEAEDAKFKDMTVVQEGETVAVTGTLTQEDRQDIVTVKKDAEGVTHLISGDIAARATVPLHVGAEGITIQEKPISILPADAIEKAAVNTVEQIEIAVLEDSPVYSIDGSASGRVFGLFPVTYDVHAQVDASTAVVVIREKPWWTMFVW